MSILKILLSLSKGSGSSEEETEVVSYNIVCDGNSLTWGYGASNPATSSYPSRLKSKEPFASGVAIIRNKGVSGQTTTAMIADAVTDIDFHYNEALKNVLIAWEIGNQIYFDGNLTVAYNDFVDYCLSRKAKGWKVICITLPYRDHSVTNSGVTPAGDSDAVYNTKRLAVNALLLENYVDFSDAILDLGNNENFSSFNSTYFTSDRVHFKDAGYELIAELLVDVILSV